MNSEITSEKVEQKGQKLYKMGKSFMVIGLYAVALFVLIGLISIETGASFIDPFIFYVADGYKFAYLFVVITYVGLLLGIAGPFLYTRGITLYALGRIAVNTEKK